MIQQQQQQQFESVHWNLTMQTLKIPNGHNRSSTSIDMVRDTIQYIL
jgi:hypothetical protein